jgi:hypothetical protein
MSKKIETYQDLIDSKKNLRKEVISLESEIKNNRIVQFSNLLVKSKTLNTTSLNSYHIPHVKDIISSPIGNIVSTFLLSNKKIRKYFIGFVIVRETVPFVISEIKKIVDEKF